MILCRVYQRYVISDCRDIILTSCKAINENNTSLDAGSVSEVGKPSDITAGLLATADRSRWPEWLCKHIHELETGGPDEFVSVVEKFVRLEMLLGFPKVCPVCKCQACTETYQGQNLHPLFHSSSRGNWSVDQWWTSSPSCY